MQPPIAPRREHVRQIHGTIVEDPWFWLRHRDDPEVIRHLEAENAYTEHATAHTAALRRAIFEEIKRRTEETDVTVPARRGAYWYATRTEEGAPYRIWVRMAGDPDGPEQVMFDENAEAEGHGYFRTTNMLVSPDDRILAHSVDVTGAERYVTRFRLIETGEDLPDEIPDTYYGAGWASDSEHFFYTVPDRVMRPWRVMRHRLGTPAIDDTVVVEEADERFFLDLARSRNGEQILVGSASATTSDVRVIPAAGPYEEPRRLLPRVAGIEYTADHSGDRFWIAINDEGRDGRLVTVEGPGAEPVEVVAHQAGTKLAAVDCFAGRTVVWGRREALPAVLVVPHGGDPLWLQMEEDVYELGPDANLEYDTSVLRYRYESFVTPVSVFDHDLETGRRQLLKQTPVLGGYRADDYVGWREWAPAADGTSLPVSLVRHRDTPLDGTAPLVVYAYGAYEFPFPVRFSIPRLSLLDRGVVYAIAHVRGGGEMGKSWHDGGRLAAKRNTFTDLIDVVDHLVETGHGDPDRVAIRGGSAGGLTVGAAARFAPDRFRAVVAEVPFVDVVNTMLDADLPLTVVEWEEWGDPNDAEQYEWLAGYAPYEEAPRGRYPALLATAGLNDPRVAYWEPAKWVAKLRGATDGSSTILLKTEMGAGHFARSGRYEAWEDEAFILAFILDQLGAADQTGAGSSPSSDSSGT